MESKPNYWAVIPAHIRYAEDLPPSAKLLYAEISSLTNAAGYCFAANAYFEELYGLAERSVIRLLKTLEKNGYIKIEDAKGGNAQRKIYAGINPLHPPDKNVSTPLTKMSVPPDKNVTHNNKINNNPPIVPQKGDGAAPKKRRAREYKETAEYFPERFELFWSAYPKNHKGGRQAAIRAWDKLKPDEALLNEMAKGLDAQLKSENWRAGFGIPHASTWLNGYRWTDEVEEAAAPPDEGAAERRYVQW